MAEVFFVLGGPGAGKGTQCSMLVKEFGLVHLSAGDLLREERQKGGETGDLIENYIREGMIVPYEITIRLLQDAMNANPCKNFLIDGFPRALDQMEAFERIVQPAKFVIFYDTSEEVMLQRLLKRGETSGRVDDNREAITKRFRTYEQTTMPVIEEFEKRGRLKKIDSTREVDTVYADSRAIFTQ